MNFKFVGAFVCVLMHLVTVAQPGYKFKFPEGVSPSDYEAGVVWVKVKPVHKEIFQETGLAAKTLSALHASKVKPFVKTKSKNGTTSRIAPRKLQVDISCYYQIIFEKTLSTEAYINELYATGYFEIVEPVYVTQTLSTPNDPSLNFQYYLNLIHAFEAWDVTQGSSAIVIGIVDTGGDMNHPDLQNNIYIDPVDPTDGIDNDGDGYIDNNRGWDFSGADASLIGTPGYIGDNDPSIYKGNRFRHGTMVAGCASATTNDGVGISGVGYNTKLLFTKHYADNQPDNSTSYSSNLYEGIYYAATHGAKIINCSWGNSQASKIAQDIITHVTNDLGCLVIAAAGNSNVESPLFPAAYDYVLSVASSDENDLRSFFSNYGKSVDIVAPGSNIYTTNYDDAYRTDSGTSLSAPIVAGAAALVWAYNPTLTGLQVGEQLRVSADETFYTNNSAYINKLGKGRLDILQALTLQSPSIRASNQMLVNDEGTMAGPGESGKLYFDFTNYLRASSPALTVTLSSSSPYVTISKNTFNLGAMGENTSRKNTDSPFELALAANLPMEQPIEVLLTFNDGNYHDVQLISFVQPSFIDINENNITTTITAAGRIGFGNTQGQSSGSGFIYNGNSLLYEMGLIIGTSSSEIYDNVRGTGGSYNQDFTPTSKIIKNTPGERSYSEITGVFRNAPTAGAESLNISYRSLVWKDDPYKNFVILEYKIKNTTLSPISNFHMGIYADWDIASGGAGDRASWDNDTRLGYVFPALPSNLPRAGVQALNSNAQYYAIDNDPNVSGNPLGIYDGFTDTEKFSTISSGLGKLQAGDVTSGSDVSHVVGVGPYTINAGEEITIAFALHGANSITALMNSAKYADSLYNYTFKAPKPVVAAKEACYESDVTLQATGAEHFHWYKDFVGGTPIHTGPQFKIPRLTNDTIVYVSNADKSYESLRSAASIIVKPNPIITASGSLQFCEGGTVTLTVDEGDEYTWSTGEKTQHIETSIDGEYSVAVKNNMLECTDEITITVYPKPIASFNTLEVIVTNDPITFTNTSDGAVSWNWEFGDGAVSDEENPVHTYASSGNYTVSLTATSDKGCEATESRDFGIITDAEIAVENTIDFYPNPVYTKTIKVSRLIAGESAEIKLFDIKGNLVSHTALHTNELQVDFNISDLSNGIYLVVISSKEKMLSRKIVIAR